ncbi:MAG: hypothetical protein Q4C44_00770 [bacterium]|nr:hypothetical protein [bacterium]
MKIKNLSLVLLLSVFIVVTSVVILKRYESETLVDAKWNEKEEPLLAITIDGNETSSFPTSSGYAATVTCTNGIGEAVWNGTKWVFNVKNIVANKAKCNIDFEFLPTWASPGNGTLLAAIKRTNTVISSPSTYPGQEISSSNEAALVSEADDYGTSYYFRGAVTNNFVEYANMCWRIVRVTGDGSIKLVLYNYNGLTDTNTTRSSYSPCSVTGTNLAYIRLGGTLYFNYNNNMYDNAYIGLMYGTTGASSYAVTHANNNASLMVSTLNNWYQNVLVKQSGFNANHLADTIWCNDKNVITNTSYDPWNLQTNGTNFGYGTNSNYYQTTQRLYQRVNNIVIAAPSLVCPNDNNGGKLSKFTVNDTKYGNGALNGYAKIGLLTADELAFAGSMYGKNNTTFYLYQNSSAEFWWTISPGDFWSCSRLWYVSKNGNLAYDGYVAPSSPNVAVRPSISLLSKVKITSGSGTSSSPYKISS